MLRNSTESKNFPRAFIIFFKKGFLKQLLEFFRTAKLQKRKNAIESHWASKKPRNVQISVFLWEKDAFFTTKSCFFSNIPRNSKFAAECNWDQKVSQSCECLCFWLGKLGFSKQINKTF